MAAPELGTKQICPGCEAKFYDLNRRPATCPKCDHTFEPEDEVALSARAKVKSKEPVPAAGKEADEEEAAEEAVTTDEDEDGEEETITELGDVNEATIPVDSSMDDDESDNGKTVPAGFTEQGVDGEDDILADDDEDTFDLDVDTDLDVDDDLPIEDGDTN